jgi:hypothetical protein
MKKELNYYVKRVNRLTLYSSTNILKLGLVFYESKLNLSKNDYELFLQMTDYKKKSRTESKWRNIGESYTRLSPIVNLLPPCWTTIYHISTLNSHQLDLLEKNDVITPTVTLKEITDFLSSKKSVPNQNIHFKLKFDSSISPLELKNIFDYIESVVLKTKCDIVYNKTTEELLNIGSSQTSQFTKII